MLAGHRQYPCLVDDVRLVHPEGTDEFFVYRSVSGQRYEVNEVAFEMLSRMDGTLDTTAICAAIRRKFHGADAVSEDLETLMKGMTAEGCLELRSGQPKVERRIEK